MSPSRGILACFSGIILVVAIFAVTVNRPVHGASQANPFNEGWQRAKSSFAHQYEAKHGDVDNATEMWLFTNAHRMCWWLTTQPRLPSEALAYGTTELKMSADQTITVTELGMKYVTGCPSYNPRR